MDRKPQRSTPPQSGQMRQGEVPPQPPIQPGAQPQSPLQTLRRIPAVRGLSPGEQQNPSPLVASVIAHQEQAVRRHTSGLETYAPQKKQQESTKGSSQTF